MLNCMMGQEDRLLCFSINMVMPYQMLPSSRDLELTLLPKLTSVSDSSAILA